MSATPSTETVSLELEDIQRGVLHPRPSPYAGTYLLLRIDDRRAGREFVRRLLPTIASAGSSRTQAQDGSVSVAFTSQGLRALGVPNDSVESFAPEFRQGMAARAVELGDRGESSPDNWEKPLGSPGVHVALAALSSDTTRLEA
ncbi:MAG: Dyp-type peroxidase, partial [Solirubrobacteraceae bacterium]